MVSEVRRALKDLRSGIEPEASMEALVSSGRAATDVLARELAMQPHSSLFTATLLAVLGRIGATDVRAIKASALSDIYRETKQFIPATVVALDRDGWIVSNLQRLATQIRRSRYRLDNIGIQRVEKAIRARDRDSKREFVDLADVLDGDLDGNLELKERYVQRIVTYLDDSVADSDLQRATTTALILGCFGPLAAAAVPSLIELLQTGIESETDELSEVFKILEAIERIGHAAGPAVPTVIELLGLHGGTLIREDGLILRVMDTLAGIGEATDEVCRMLRTASEHPAAIIQDRANDTLWKLCLELEV